MDQGKRICCEVNSLFCYILYRFKKISAFSGYKVQGIICPEFLYCYFYSMKFDICVGNPPYMGKGDPLYMQITKAAYDTVLDKNGVMCMINPTGIVDNKLLTE